MNVIVKEDISANYSVAVQVHYEIMTTGKIAASALAEMCRNLKRMRDEKLYLDLGHDTFEEYCENMAGIKARQVYTYISTFERLGQDVLQSNANIGITKLELLSQLPASIRDEMLNDPDEVKDMSTSEIKKLVDEAKKQSEQIDMLKSEVQKQKSGNDDLTEKIRNQKKEIADKKEIERKLKETEKQLKEAKTKLEEISTAVDPEPQQIEINEIISEVKAKVKQEYDEIIAQMDKKLKLSGVEAVTVKLHLAAIKGEYEKLSDYISGLPGDERIRYSKSIIGLLEILKTDAENLVERDD